VCEEQNKAQLVLFFITAVHLLVDVQYYDNSLFCVWGGGVIVVVVDYS
jgi:hypothetical protein